MIAFNAPDRFLKIIFATALVAIALAISYFRIFEIYELQTYDLRCHLRGDRPLSSDIAIIEIEENTLKALGKWPFSRQHHANLINRLTQLGAQAIVFDILFVEPSPNDAFLAHQARLAKNVIFADAFSQPQTNPKGVTESLENIAPVRKNFEKSSLGVGYTNVKVDRDGKRRRIYPTISFQGKNYYHLGIQTAIKAFGLDAKDLKIPLDDEGCMIINFASTWQKGFAHYSYVGVLSSFEELRKGLKPSEPIQDLKGKVCFVGLTALGSHDAGAVPREAVYPMTGLYANVLNSILQKDYIFRLSRAGNIFLMFIIGLCVYSVSKKPKPFLALLGVLLIIISFIGLATLIFIWRGLWIDIFYPTCLFFVIYALVTFVKIIFEIKKRELIEQELRLASQIQKSFLPSTTPNIHGLDFAAVMKPAKAVGGDLYAFTAFNSQKVGVMIGDVSGKGTPAALFMAKVVSEFKHAAANVDDPSKVLDALNQILCQDGTEGLFVTLSYAIFDLSKKKFFMSGAGHPALIRMDKAGGVSYINPAAGAPAGVFEETKYLSLEKELSSGDIILFISDGITEARNTKREEFGMSNLENILRKMRSSSANQILEALLKAVSSFMDKAPIHDDMTVVVIKVGGA